MFKFSILLVIMLPLLISMHYSQCGKSIQAFPVGSFRVEEVKWNLCSFPASLLKSMQLEFQQPLKMA